MTDLSKIDFTQLKLDNVGAAKVHADSVRNERVDLFFGTASILYKRENQDWVTTSYAAGLNREQVNELFKRTEQVDEFIRQQSRRRITTIQLARELIDNDREICVQARYTIGAVTRYRFNRSMCRFEFYDAGCWNLCTDLGDSNLVVTILD